MNNVKIVTSDGKIWNAQQTIFDLLQASQKGPVFVNLLHEGPCCLDVGLEDILDQVCSLQQISKDHFIIVTSNQLSSSKYPQRRTPFVELDTAQQRCLGTFSSSTLEKKFGIFIGRSNSARLRLASYLYKYCRDQTEMTFHYDPANDFHRSNFGLEQSIEKCWDDRYQIFDFLDHLPLKTEEHTYPILWSQRAFDLEIHYRKIFCDIVCETYTLGKSFFVTEKTFRCISNYRPFVVQGPRHFLTNLKKLGFKTFDAWWDEGYDTDPEDARYQGIVGNINWIDEQSKNTLEQWHKEMQPLLEHNVCVLQSLTDEQITKTEFYYD